MDWNLILTLRGNCMTNFPFLIAWGVSAGTVDCDVLLSSEPEEFFSAEYRWSGDGRIHTNLGNGYPTRPCFCGVIGCREGDGWNGINP